jgi:hypothetical protein
MTAPIVVRVGDLELRAESRDDELRILDLDLARQAEMPTPYGVRRLIERAIGTGLLTSAGLIVTKTIKPKAGKNGSVRASAVTEYWLTETGAHLIAMRIDTPLAVALSRKMAIAFREGGRQLRAAPIAATIDLSVATGARMGDSPEGRERVASACGMAARSQDVSIHAVHGFLRRVFKVPSAYAIPIVAWSPAHEMLVAIAKGDLPIRKPRLVLSNIRQMPLPGVRP